MALKTAESGLLRASGIDIVQIRVFHFRDGKRTEAEMCEAGEKGGRGVIAMRSRRGWR